MLKKLASLLLSLLPGKAGAADVPEDVPPARAEAPEERPDDPDALVMVMSEDFPEKDSTEKTQD